MTGWIADAKDRAGLADVARALRIEMDRRGTLAPCPGCGAERRGSSDKRGPVGVRPDGRGWRCHRCGVGGDVVDLAAVRLTGATMRDATPEQRADVRAWFADHGACDPAPGTVQRRPVRPLPRRQAVEQPVEHPRPPAAEVAALWAACGPVDEDREVAAWLESRGLDPVRVSDRDLARALPAGGPLPGWARCSRRPWTDGWRCILPAVDDHGAVRSLRARWCREMAPRDFAPPGGLPKGSAAAAGPGSASGLVLADGLARQLLAKGKAPGWWPAGVPVDVVVLEGETDFLTWGTRWGDAAATAPALLGIWAGSWTDTIAARVPGGARIAIRTDPDDAGDKYGATIARSLVGRCDVRRLQRGRTAA